MALKFANLDLTTGLNDGSSWTDAWQSMDDIGANASAGDDVYVHSGSSEIQSTANWTITFANGTKDNPVRVISVDKDNSDAYTTGALFGTSTNRLLYISGSVALYGMEIDNANQDVYVCQGNGSRQIYEDCTINAGNGGGDTFVIAGAGGFVEFINCTITIYTGLEGKTGQGTVARFVNCNIVSGSGTELINDIEPGARWEFISCDLSDFSSIVDGSEDAWSVHIIDCVLYNGTITWEGEKTHYGKLLVERSGSDTDAATPGLVAYSRGEGTVEETLSVYRSGGADDGEQANAHSWKMVADQGVTKEYSQFLDAPWCTRWVDGGVEITLTFYVASAVTLDDDEFWVEVISPDEAATSTMRGEYKTNKPASVIATPSNLDTDSSSTWNGSGVGTKQEITIGPFTPDQSGPLRYRACLARETTVYFDPKVEVA